MTIPAKAIVVFKPSGKVVEAEVGANLLDVALWPPAWRSIAPCGGQGRCGRCKVLVEMGAVARRPSAKLGSVGGSLQGYALACQTIIKGDLVVVVPTKEEIERRPKVETAAEKIALPFACDWRKQPAIRKFYLEIEPPSLADNTNDLDRLRRELARQHRHQGRGGEPGRAQDPGARPARGRLERHRDPGHAQLGRGRHRAAAAAGRSSPATAPRRNYGLAVDIGTTSVVRLPGGLRRRLGGGHGQRLQRPDLLRRGRHLAHRLLPARRRPGAPAAAGGGHHQRPAVGAVGPEQDQAQRRSTRCRWRATPP